MVVRCDADGCGKASTRRVARDVHGRATLSVVTGTTAQAVAAAQGHALRSLLTTWNAPGPADQAETGTSDGAAAPSDENG